MEKLNEKTENKIPGNQKTQKPEVHCTQKQPYESPKAIFVPLKLEERLLACNWSGSLGPPPICSKSGLS